MLSSIAWVLKLRGGEKLARGGASMIATYCEKAE